MYSCPMLLDWACIKFCKTNVTNPVLPLTYKQVRANVYILERSPLRVHSISMDQTYCMDRPEMAGWLVFPAIWHLVRQVGECLGPLLRGEDSIFSPTAGASLTRGGQRAYYSYRALEGWSHMSYVGLRKSNHAQCHLKNNSCHLI